MSSKLNLLIGAVVAGSTLALAACATAPKTSQERENLQNLSQATLETMKSRNPNLGPRLEQAYAYAIFPEVGKAGAVAGGAYGRGVVYEQGQLAGYASLTQASLGAQLGAQTFAELVVFDDRDAFLEFKRGGWNLTGTASAVILQSGAAQTFPITGREPLVIVMTRGGAMLDLSIAGQELDFTTVPI